MSGRSHPPSLLRIVERALLDDALAPRGARVLVACSGGPDSNALLHALARLRERLGFSLIAHGVDHGLRASASMELEKARAIADAEGVPFAITRVALAAGSNLQARARAARFGALVDAARRGGAFAIATGHTADDRAETLLLRLLRGAGPRGLAVLPPRAPAPGAADVSLVRPLLRARRTDVLAHLARHELAFATDPSNADSRFARARIRFEVLPLLATLSPRIVEHLGDLADMLANPNEDPALAKFGRAQRKTVERARRLGRGRVTLRLENGREVDVVFSPSGGVLIEEH